jgi:hypothetical protein
LWIRRLKRGLDVEHPIGVGRQHQHAAARQG